MFNRKQNILAAALLMACAGTAFAAEQAELKVTGKILPAACNVTLSGGGAVNFGDIQASKLHASAQSDLPYNSSQFKEVNIACDSPMGVAVNVVENKPGTAAILDSKPGIVEGSVFGFGQTKSGKPIGGYRIVHTDAEVFTDNGGTGNYLISSDKKAWATAKPNQAMEIGKYYSIGAHGTEAPGAYKKHIHKLAVYGNVVGTKDLDLTDALVLDGQATFQISYLP